MNPERWRQIEDLYRAALEPGRRESVLSVADPELRSEVEALLAPQEQAGESTLTAVGVGARLGRYVVEAPLGKGGMGEVFRARDTRLGRLVAIKVSHAQFSERFEREARAISALNHPHICTLYDVGPNFLVMELVEGVTLSSRLKEGALAIDQVLQWGVQIADALAAAHAKAITHRDLKPGNIMLSKMGVKVLDFGLAKIHSQPGDALTQSNVVMGTPAYMAPEQFEGKEADARSDIYSLGMVLYEMATGKRATQGQMPPLDGLPEKFGHVVERCLAPDPEERWQAAGDIQRELKWAGTERVQALPPRRSLRREVVWAAIALAGVLAAVTLAFVGALALRRTPEAPPLPTVKFTFTPHRLARGSYTDIDAEVSISPDGRHISYVESDDGQLWLRDLNQEQARPVPGAKGVYQAFWSPDNQFIGYTEGRELMRIPVQGGTPVPIAKLKGDSFRRASWSSDGETIVFCDSTGMYTVPAKGGSLTLIVEHPHIEHPSFLNLPDGRQAVLYQSAEFAQNHAISVRVIGEDKGRLLTMSSSSNPYPAYSSSGHIIYVDGQDDTVAIWALPFSLATLQATGKAFPIAQLGSSPQVSRTDTLVYSDAPSTRMQLAWSDRSGKILSTIGDPQREGNPTLSPDGRRLAVVSRAERDIWIYDLERGIRTRFTFDGAIKTLGAWGPAGNAITYSAYRNGSFDILTKASSGNGEAIPVISTALDERDPDWSPDQRILVYGAVSPETRSDLIYRERNKDGSFGDPVAFLKTPFNESSPRLSPDGRFVAYVSDESGRREVYVRDFPMGANKWQISANGGTAPRWRRDGKEVFYVDGNRLMAGSVTTLPAFSVGTPKLLFEKQVLQSAQYDVSADGQRFLLLDRPINEAPLSIHVAYNWFAEFRGPRRN